jgi:hypothetical protein
MIDTATIGGTPLDPCHVLAEVTVIHGRGSFGEGGQPSSATIRVEVPAGAMPGWKSGDTLTLAGPDGPMFAGRIVDQSLEHFTEHDADWGRFTLTAAGALAALGLRKVGDVPWPQESGIQRAAHILTAAQVGYRVEGDQDLQILPRDVDSQPAAGLLDELAAATSAAVFDTPDGQVVYQSLASRSRIRPLLWHEIPTATWADYSDTQTWADFEGVPSPTSEFPLLLPCEVVEYEPEWTTSESQIVNQVQISYGAAEPQETVELLDSASIAAHHLRYWQLSTELATLADATTQAAHVISTLATERWALGNVTVAVSDLDDAMRAQVLGLLCGDQVTVARLPQPAPASDWTGIVEGWTFTQTGSAGVVVGRITLALSDPLHSLVVYAWQDYEATFEWQHHDVTWTWDNLEKVPA